MANFGPHLIIDLKNCNKEKLSDIDLVRDILTHLPEKIGMTRISEPQVFYYKGDIPEDHGVTGTVVLAESHCSIHTFQDKGYCFVDIFSCKPFDTDKALREIKETFKAKECDYQVILRGRDFPREENK